MKKKIYLKRVKSYAGCRTEDNKICYFAKTNEDGDCCNKPLWITCTDKIFIQIPDPLQELWEWCEKKIKEWKKCGIKIARDRILSYQNIQRYINHKSELEEK